MDMGCDGCPRRADPVPTGGCVVCAGCAALWLTEGWGQSTVLRGGGVKLLPVFRCSLHTRVFARLPTCAAPTPSARNLRVQSCSVSFTPTSSSAASA